MRPAVVVAVVAALGLAACGGEQFPSAATDTATTTPGPPAPMTDATAQSVPTTTPGVAVSHTTSIAPVYADPTTPGEIVDPAEARDVATRIWNERVQANYDRDVAGLMKIETGAALDADIGYICLLGCRGRLLTADTVAVNLPHQTGWPVAFSASVAYTNGCLASQPCHDIFVVVQQAKGAPWKVAHYITYAGTVFAQEPALATGGWAISPAPGALLATGPASYAAYLQSLNRTGRPPEATSMSSQWFDLSATDTERATRSLEPFGLRETLTYRVDPGDPLYSFAGSNSVQFACGSIRFTETVTRTGNLQFVQPTNLSLLGDNVRPGVYRSVVINGVNMACFEQHLGDSTMTVIGEWGDVTTATATP